MTEKSTSMPHPMDETHRAVHRVGVVSGIANLTLAVLKVVAGYVGHSRAVVADGIHSFTDLASDIAVVVGVRYWSAPADEDHPYGHRRIETMITLVIALLLAGAALGLMWDAVRRLGGERSRLPTALALFGGVVSLVAKEILYQWNMRIARKHRSSALRANAWHHRSDAFSSIPAVLAVIGVWINPNLWMLDMVGAVIISVLIFHAAWKIAWPGIQELADRGADCKTVEALQQMAEAVDGVREIHKLRTRFVGSGLAVDLHVQVEPETTVREGHAISTRVRDKLLDDGPDVVDVLTHLEPYERLLGE